MLSHLIEDCPQKTTFEHFGKTLDRLESHAVRQAEAMEEIARNSIMTESHEKRLDKNDHDLSELYGRVRIIEMKKANLSDVAAQDMRLRTLELDHAIESGAEEVVESRQKFWDGVKQQITPHAVIGMIFIIWLLDKFNIPVALAKLWKEMGK
jgi:uncharacterized coiled-coil protein SlyX